MQNKIYKIGRKFGLNEKDIKRVLSSRSTSAGSSGYGTASPKEIYKGGTIYGTTNPKEIYKGGTIYGTFSTKDLY